jgi:hypothetical protein
LLRPAELKPINGTAVSDGVTIWFSLWGEKVEIQRSNRQQVVIELETGSRLGVQEQEDSLFLGDASRNA